MKTKKMHHLLYVSFCFVLTFCLLAGCTNADDTVESEPSLQSNSIESSLETTITDESSSQTVSIINLNGTTIKERFLLPEGFSRVETEDGSFEEFLQSLPLKPDGSKVKYYNGSEKTRDVYLAVVDYTLGESDLQQCADAVMRLRAEYLYETGQQDKIHFNFVSGFTASFSKWASGYGISVSGDDAEWVNNSRNDSSYESFQRYLEIVYAYANTYSLEQELVSKDISELAIGDVFIRGGFPGHCVIVVDLLVNDYTGEKVFMLAQSYMPAQDIQILKGDSDSSPWYSANIDDSLHTPEWTFQKNQLKTWQ